MRYFYVRGSVYSYTTRFGLTSRLAAVASRPAWCTPASAVPHPGARGYATAPTTSIAARYSGHRCARPSKPPTRQVSAASPKQRACAWRRAWHRARTSVVCYAAEADAPPRARGVDASPRRPRCEAAMVVCSRVNERQRGAWPAAAAGVPAQAHRARNVARRRRR